MNLFDPQKPADKTVLQSDRLNIKRILAPVDFSACTLETLRYAALLAGKFRALVDVLHIVQPRPGRNEDPGSCSGLIEIQKEGAREELKKLTDILRMKEGVDQISARIRDGWASEVIVSEAGSSNADVIIMGTRNRSWLSGLLRRNTVRHVIQNSPCPVIVLRNGMRNS
jgi:nucleotide-binding universal stress UspA family protein